MRLNVDYIRSFVAFFTVFLVIIFVAESCTTANKAKAGEAKAAPKPLYQDPIYNGAADPVNAWNNKEKKWFMFYTNWRATMDNSGGVEWVHGTRIGIAESKDGAIWKYRDTANINYRPTNGYTHWAPDVIEHAGTYHMYLKR